MALDASIIQHMREVVQASRFGNNWVMDCGHPGSFSSAPPGSKIVVVGDMLHCVLCQAAAYSRNSQD